MTSKSAPDKVQIEVTRDGEPAMGATVVFVMGGETLDTLRTDERGRVQWPWGTRRVVNVIASTEGARSRKQTVFADRPSVTLALVPETSLLVSVTDGSSPLPGARVHLPHESLRVVTDEAGQARFDHLPVGRAVLSVEGPPGTSFRPEELLTISLAHESPSRFDLDLVRLHPVQVRFQEASGEPLGAERVNLQCRGTENRDLSFDLTAEGEACLLLAAGSYTLTWPERGIDRTPIEVPARTSVTLVTGDSIAATTFRGVVVGPDGARIGRSLNVYVVWSDEMPDNVWVMEPQVETDSQGRFTVEEHGDTLRVVAADPSEDFEPSIVVLLQAETEAIVHLGPPSTRRPTA